MHFIEFAHVPVISLHSQWEMQQER